MHRFLSSSSRAAITTSVGAGGKSWGSFLRTLAFSFLAAPAVQAFEAAGSESVFASFLTLLTSPGAGNVAGALGAPNTLGAACAPGVGKSCAIVCTIISGIGAG